MNYFSEFLTVAIVHLLVAMSPGPDFILITRNSLFYSRRSGIFSAAGLALGILVHVMYSLVGIGLIISSSILLFSIFKFAAAGYLIYIGWRSLGAQPSLGLEDQELKRSDLGRGEAFRMGFWSNVTNPKVTLFFLSLFTLVVDPATPTWIKSLYGLEMVIATFAWFSLVALLFSHPWLRRKMGAVQHWAERAMGVILIALGIRIIFSKPQ
jgi:RhtB (resistance to homoserine/threonine) family protein